MGDLILAEAINLLNSRPDRIINMIIESEQKIAELKKEETKLAAQRKWEEAELEEFKEKVKAAMESNSIEKIQTDIGTLNVRLNPISIDVTDIEKIPEEFKTTKVTIVADKKKIADHFKSTGEVIDGVTVNTEKTTLIVK